jgi:hypothetical protein
MITPTRDEEIKAPEETTNMARAQAGDVDLTERGLIKVDRSYVIAELRTHEPCKVDMTILAFIGNQRDEKNKGRSGDQRNGEIPGEERQRTMTGALRRITSAASRGSCGSTPLSNQEGGFFVKKRAARAMRTTRTGAERARMRGRLVLVWVGSFARERRPLASPGGGSDTVLLIS